MPAEKAPTPQAQKHVAQLADGGIGENFLDVVLDQADGRGEKRRGAADDGHHEHGSRRMREQNVRARDDVDARSDHGGRVDQGADRRGAFHGVRQPDVERKLRRFAGRAHEQQQARGGQDAKMPQRIRRSSFPAFWNTVTKSSEPKVRKSRNIPSMKPKSPMRLTMNAFFPASEADFRRK